MASTRNTVNLWRNVSHSAHCRSGRRFCNGGSKLTSPNRFPLPVQFTLHGLFISMAAVRVTLACVASTSPGEACSSGTVTGHAQSNRAFASNRRARPAAGRQRTKLAGDAGGRIRMAQTHFFIYAFLRAHGSRVFNLFRFAAGTSNDGLRVSCPLAWLEASVMSFCIRVACSRVAGGSGVASACWAETVLVRD